MEDVKIDNRTISFDAKFNKTVDRLSKTKNTGGTKVYFANMYELLIFAACLGFSKKFKAKFSKSTNQDKKITIPYFQFRSFDDFDGIFYAIILSDSLDDSMDLSILENTEQNIRNRIEIFTNYINLGLQIIEDEVLTPDLPVGEQFMFMIEDFINNKDSSINEDLSYIDSLFGR